MSTPFTDLIPVVVVIGLLIFLFLKSMLRLADVDETREELTEEPGRPFNTAQITPQIDKIRSDFGSAAHGRYLSVWSRRERLMKTREAVGRRSFFQGLSEEQKATANLSAV